MTKATQKKYLARITATEEKAGGIIKWYKVGDKLTIEVYANFHDLSDKSDLMHQWEKRGLIKKAFPTHLAVQTCYENECGREKKYNSRDFNITITRECKWNFEYLREATRENELELVAECIRLAVKAGAIK